MFKILVDGVERACYDENEWRYITVGSGADATLRLPWADEKLVDIHPMEDGGFLVEIHTPHGMLVRKWLTEEMHMRHRDPKCAGGGKVHVGDGWPMKIMGHTIQAITIRVPTKHATGRRCCGQEWKYCTCGQW